VAANSIIPDVVLIRPQTGLVPRNELKDSAPDVEIQQLTVAASGTPISLPYGRVRIGAKVTQPVQWGVQLLLPCIIGQGPIDAVEAVEFDNKPAPAGVSWTIYTGAPGQGIDPWLQTAWALQGKTYADTLPGIAYVVLRLPKDSEVAPESVSFIVRGLKVFDPRQRNVVLDATTSKKATIAVNAGQSVSGVTRLRIAFVGALNSWSACATYQVLVSRWGANPNATVSLQLRSLANGGQPEIAWSENGNPAGAPFLTCNVAAPLADGQFGGVMVDLNLSDGGQRTAQFYWSLDGIWWTPLGPKVGTASAGSLFDNVTAKWQVGGRSDGAEAFNVIGRAHYATVQKTASFTDIVQFDPRNAALAATSWNSPQGQTWTIAGGPTVVDDVYRYSANPTLCTAHFLTEPGIGARKKCSTGRRRQRAPT
jgi:hypothetical protein